MLVRFPLRCRLPSPPPPPILTLPSPLTLVHPVSARVPLALSAVLVRRVGASALAAVATHLRSFASWHPTHRVDPQRTACTVHRQLAHMILIRVMVANSIERHPPHWHPVSDNAPSHRDRPVEHRNYSVIWNEKIGQRQNKADTGTTIGDASYNDRHTRDATHFFDSSNTVPVS